MRRILLAGTTVVALLLWTSASNLRAAGPTFEITDLGTAAGSVPTVTGINASGQISGWISSGTGDRAVRYTNEDGWALVPGLESITSYATGINDHGDLVGYAMLPSGAMRAFRYVAGGAVEFIAPLGGGSFTLGAAINNSGVIVGYGDATAGLRGFRQSPSLLPEALDAFGGPFSMACGINDQGQIVGSAATSTGAQHAFRQEVDGTVVDVPGLDGPSGLSAACAIDANGAVTGQATTADGSVHAFLFAAGPPADLDTFGSPSSNGAGVAAGVVVGSWTVADGTTRAFEHTADGGTIDMNTLVPAGSGWVLTSGTAVNASGWMVGQGMLNGKAAAWRLMPKPDTVPPAITAIGATPSVIDLPNGATVPVSVNIAATDDVDPAPACGLTGVTATGAAAGDAAVTGQFSANVRAVGGATYSLTVRCTDAAGNHSDASTTVTVRPDTQAPAIQALSVTPSQLHPDKRMVPVTVAVSATDNIDSAPTCSITAIGSTQGNAADAAITGPLTATLRATLDNQGATRTYTLRVTCGDAAQNVTTGDVTVQVKGGPCALNANQLVVATRHWVYRRHGRGR